MSARFSYAAALLLAACAARAEVRVVRGSTGPELRVRPATAGTWTPLAPLDAATVNPGGDLIGDGYPGQGTGRGKLVAAWQRPSTSNLVILRATAPTSFSLEELPVSPEGGVPAVAAIDRAWLVAWQAGLDNPEVIVVTGNDSEMSDATPIVLGELVGVFKVAPAIHVVTVQRAANTLTIATFAMLHEPNPEPIPTLTRVPLVSATARGAMALMAPSTSPWPVCVEERAADTLLAWKAGQSLLGRAVLESDGVHADGAFVRGPNGSCQGVLNAAGRN